MNQSFALAPMSPLIRGLTLALGSLPLILGLWALISRQPVDIFTCLLLIALYAAVWWGCRPSRFVLVSQHLAIVFPGWQRRIPRADIASVRIITAAAFRQEFGLALRICVGGLWGGFGWLWTSRRGLVEFYISQLDTFVLIERSQGRTLLLTPEHPQQFVAAMQAHHP